MPVVTQGHTVEWLALLAKRQTYTEMSERRKVGKHIIYIETYIKLTAQKNKSACSVLRVAFSC